jgi:parallel beta-helix repeat protein
MKRVVSILFALVLVLAFGLMATTPVAAATLYVPSGYATIQAAIDAANPGDTIIVAAGTYNLAASIRVTESVSIIGDISNPENVVINAGTIPINSGPKPPDRDRDAFQVAANNVTIRGFKIMNAISVLSGSGDGWQNCGITIGGDITLIDWLDPGNEPILIDGGTFSDNIVQNCTNGIYLAMAKNAVVRNNIVRNITTDRAGADGVGIINWNTKAWGAGNYQDPTNNTIEGNLVENCERIGICLGAWGERFSVSGTVIRDNIIRNSELVAGIQLLYIDGPLSITGNDISGNPCGIDILGGGAYCTGVLVTCNNISDNTNYGINNGGANVLDARHNWWGDDSGPTHPSNPSGTGDAASDNVDFDPWIGKPGSVWTETDTGWASFSASSGGVANLTAVTTPAGAPVELPHGMFSFTICCLDPDEEVTVEVTLPADVPVGTVWWKYENGHWYSIPNLSDNGDEIMVISLTDGGSGDGDSVPGQITDDGGPGNPGAVGWETYPVSKVRVLLPWIALLAAVMVGVSLLVLRRRQTTT